MNIIIKVDIVVFVWVDFKRRDPLPAAGYVPSFSNFKKSENTSTSLKGEPQQTSWENKKKMEGWKKLERCSKAEGKFKKNAKTVENYSLP